MNLNAPSVAGFLGLTLGLLTLLAPASSQETSEVGQVSVEVNLTQGKYIAGQDWSVDVKLLSVGDANLRVPSPLLPEGQSIHFYISDAQNKLVYSTPSSKHGRVASANVFDLPPGHFVGARFSIASQEDGELRFEPGVYWIEAAYQIPNNAATKDIPQGTWSSAVTKVVVLAPEDKR